MGREDSPLAVPLQAGVPGSHPQVGAASGGWEVRPHLDPCIPGPQVEASSPGQDRWLRDYCASGLYILTLLLEGYRFSEDTWPNIEFRKQVTASQGPSHQPLGKGGSGAAALIASVSHRPVALTSAGHWATC